MASCSSDGAARATTRAIAELRKTELDEAQKAVDSHLEEHPEELKEAIAAYLDMSDEQREQAETMHELGCAGHALNLVTDDSWKKSEKTVIKENMARDRAAVIIQRSFLALSSKTTQRSYFMYCLRTLKQLGADRTSAPPCSTKPAAWRRRGRRAKSGEITLVPNDKHDGVSDCLMSRTP